MAVHNNKDILMVHYEDLPAEDKDVIGKAIEEFQNKCLLSYTKTCDKKVIQKWKCNQSLIVGFGDNDHTIRDPMKFIEMTSREFIFKDATWNGGASNYNVDGFKLKGGLNSFIYWIWV